MSKEITRRSFLKTGTAVAAGLAVAPNIIIAGEKTPKKEKKKKVAPSDKLNILGVGIGGRGAADLAEMETENIIGLCDVDWKYADHVFNKYPQAKKYNDYRVMFDEMLDQADAVMVATADAPSAAFPATVSESPGSCANAPAEPVSSIIEMSICFICAYFFLFVSIFSMTSAALL